MAKLLDAEVHAFENSPRWIGLGNRERATKFREEPSRRSHDYEITDFDRRDATMIARRWVQHFDAPVQMHHGRAR